MSVDAYSVMGNVYFEAPLSTVFKPYLGAGAGYGWVDSNVGVEDDGAAIGGMAGLGFEVVENITLDVGYKYRRIFLSGTDFDDER